MPPELVGGRPGKASAPFDEVSHLSTETSQRGVDRPAGDEPEVTRPPTSD